jgi:hypothetical protein
LEGLWFEASLREIVPETPISRITRAKWTGGVAQVTEHLLCKYEALSSNSILTKTTAQDSMPYPWGISRGICGVPSFW